MPNRDTEQTVPEGADPGGAHEIPPSMTAALYAPIAPLTAFEETVERLGSAIRLGILEPGSRLPAERDLATSFQISRSTLREAITALVQAGLLTTRRGRGGGTWVASEPEWPAGPATPEEEWSAVLDVRIAVEAGCALLAAERATEDILAQMDLTAEDLEVVVAAGGTYAEYRRLDARFHLLLAEASGSTPLVARMAEVQDDMSRLTGFKEWPAIVLERSNAQHKQLVASIRRGDGGGAAEILFEHVEGTRHIFRGMGTE